MHEGGGRQGLAALADKRPAEALHAQLALGEAVREDVRLRVERHLADGRAREVGAAPTLVVVVVPNHASRLEHEETPLE